jgi:hypothetical protein
VFPFYLKPARGNSGSAALGQARVFRDIRRAGNTIVSYPCETRTHIQGDTCRHAITCSHACNYMLNVFKAFNLIKSIHAFQVFMSCHLKVFGN